MSKREIQVQVGQTITDLLKGHNRGRTEHDVSTKLTELVRSVREQKRGGSLQITIGVEPVKGGVDRLWITVEPKLKAPQASPPSDIRFTDDQGGLHESSPYQMELQPEGMPK